MKLTFSIHSQPLSHCTIGFIQYYAYINMIRDQSGMFNTTDLEIKLACGHNMHYSLFSESFIRGAAVRIIYFCATGTEGWVTHLDIALKNSFEYWRKVLHSFALHSVDLDWYKFFYQPALPYHMFWSRVHRSMTPNHHLLL